MNETLATKPIGTGETALSTGTVTERTGIRMTGRFRSLCNALKTAMVVVACTLASAPAYPLEVERKFEISETDLTQQVNALRKIFTAVWVDIRSEPKVFNGRTYSGFISIHARDPQGRVCRWDTAFEEILTDFEPPFNPIETEAVVSNCAEWSAWEYISWPIGDWVVTKVHPRFINFDGMPIMSNISAKGYYYPDKLVLVMRLRSVDLRGVIDKQLDPSMLPLDKLYKK